MGDHNTAYVHSLVKIRQAHDAIKFMKDEQWNSIIDTQQIKEMEVQFYQRLFSVLTISKLGLRIKEEC